MRFQSVNSSPKPFGFAPMKRGLVLKVLVATLGVLVLASVNGYAQEIWGTLVGTVKDTSGAVMAGVSVKLTNEGTKVSFATTTDANGDYRLGKLPAGTCTLEMEHSGFKRYVQAGITIKIAAIQRADVTMEVGAVTQEVVVKADVVMLETETFQQGGTMPSALIQNLPLLGLSWTNLAVLFPGAQQDPDRLGHSFNGARSTANNFLVNGIDANDPALNTILVEPSPDAIQEFRLITNTMNPEYGRNSGSLMQVVTKSGTNTFHGKLLYFHRDKGLNARDFFDATKPDFNRNQWGGTVGGPIFKDRTFFFFDYLALKQKIPNRASDPFTPNNPVVYTSAERSGDFSVNCPRDDVDDPCFTSGGASIGVTPFAGFLPGPGSVLSGPQPAGTDYSALWPDGIIPTGNFNPIAVKYLDFIPLPNSSGDKFISVGSAPTNEHKPGKWALKIDHQMAKDTLSGSFFYRNSKRSRPFAFTGANVPGFGDVSETHVRQFTLTHTHTFGTRVVNEARYGYSRLWFNTVFPDRSDPGNKPPSDFGFTGINPQDLGKASAPKMEIASTLFVGFSDNGPQPRVDDTHQVTDNLSWIQGRHTLKFGFDFRHARIFNPFSNALNGVFTFDGAGTYTTGSGYVDFLLGLPDSYSQGSGSTLDARNDLWYFYGQDEFKVTPSLKLTYGLSWTLDRNWINKFNQGVSIIAFRPGCESALYPTAPVGICFTGDPGIPRGGLPVRKKNFNPRFGFAWTPNLKGDGFLGRVTGGSGKFVIRGGYGIYRDNIFGEGPLQTNGSPPIGLTITSPALAPSFANPWASVDGSSAVPNPFPASPAPPFGSRVDFSTYEPLSITSFDPNFRVAYTQSFNLTVERQFREDWLLRLAYVGSLGRNLLSTYEGNPVDSALAASLGCPRLFTQVVCPEVTRHVPGDVLASVFAQGSFANSSYNSFQTFVEKRLSRGLTFQASYTFSKSLDNSNGLEGDAGNFQTVTPDNPKRDRSFSEFDARHRFVLSYFWEIPAPKQGVLNRIAGGWKVSGISTFATGYPVFLTTSDDRCLIGLAFTFGNTYCRPNLVGPIKIFDPRDDIATKQGLQNPNTARTIPSNAFFDPTAFARVPAGSGELGTAPRSLFHGPGFNNFNIGIAKDIRITERVSLTPRFEFFNAFNHAQFQNPSGNANSTSFARVSRTRSLEVGSTGARIIQMGLKLTF